MKQSKNKKSLKQKLGSPNTYTGTSSTSMTQTAVVTFYQTGSSKQELYDLKAAYQKLLQTPLIAKSISKEHIEKTPLRVVRALSELLSGYAADPVSILSTSFNSGKYNEMITVGDVGFTSLCCHHFLPFFGKCYFAYIPDKHIVGLSKIPRLIEAFSHRLQVQETLSEQIVDCFQQVVKPKGCAITIQATHLCMSIRGVRKEGAYMRTTALRGIFAKDASAKAEFLSGIGKKL